MANASLSAIEFGKSFESALGTNATPNVRLYGKSDVSPAFTFELDDNVRGHAFEASYTLTAKAQAGTLSGPASSDWLALLFKYLMHARPTTTGVGDPYTHTWTDIATGSPMTGGFNQSGTHSWTFLAKIAAIASYIYRFDGCNLSSLTISGSGSGKVMLSAAVQGIGDIVATTDPGTSPSTEGYYIGRKTTLTVGGTTLSTLLSSWSITFTNGIAVMDRAGSTAGEGTSIDHTGTFGVEFTYSTDEASASANGALADYLAGTDRAVVLTISGDSNRDTTITLAKCQQVEGYPVRVNEHGVYVVERKVRALYDTGNTPDIFTVAVRNGVSAYT